MTNTSAPPVSNSTTKRFKGSLAGTLVRTLLIFTIIPLVLMAGAAYLRARSLLREQAIAQAESLLVNQLSVVEKELQNKESRLNQHLSNRVFLALIETSLRTESTSPQFSDVRNRLVVEMQGEFDHFFLIDTEGKIIIASNTAWEGNTTDPLLFGQEEIQTLSLYGIPSVRENEFILATSGGYQTVQGSQGSVVGITERQSLQRLIQPLNGLAPFANAYFILSNGQMISNNPTTGWFVPEAGSSEFRTELTSNLDTLRQAGDQKPLALDINSLDGEPSLVQIQWVPQMQSGVALEIESSKIYGQINSLAPFTIFLVLGTLTATAIALTYGTRRTFQPLQSLTSITRKFAEGDWSLRAEVRSNDEVGMLAHSFNDMADQLSEIYQSLEKKVDERARQIRTAAEVAQSITTIPNLDEMLNKTAEGLVREFGYYQASIFMVERGGRYVDFKAGHGSATQGLTDRQYRLEVGSASLIGWVAANNQTRVASDVLEDPLHLKNEFLPETRSEASVPISLGDQVLGILDVQSTQPRAFSADTLVMLQTLASQIAAAIQTNRLVETSQVNFQELERLYRASRQIAEANSEAEIITISSQILRNAPYPIVMFKVAEGRMNVIMSSDSTRGAGNVSGLQEQYKVQLEALENFIFHGAVETSPTDPNLPPAFQKVMQSLGLSQAAFLPVYIHNELTSVIMIGSRQQNLSSLSIQPYENLAGLMSITLERIVAVEQRERHLREVEALASINELISLSTDIQGFFRDLLEKIHKTIGNYNMLVALYDEKENSISVPFNYEDGEIISIDSFPLGEGLTSILLRTRQPLMLVEDTERRAAELGAKTVGRSPKSWMGAPMLVQGNPIGVLIIQDLEKEHAFDEDDLKFFTTLAGQVAGVMHSVRLLDESNRKALQLETAAEIARDISGSLDLDELLTKAVKLIQERFNFYHASVFLMDLPREFAVIREATGEAGAQMKRVGYKIGAGSKSIVGYVTGRGESLIVNDTSKDATYYANPLLPDTRAEAAIPLRVGDRILGALDVQSTKPFAFSADNLASLQILADQLAVAVANTELFAETQEHLSQHRLLHHITSTAASGTTLEEALESAVGGLQVTLGGDRVTILLANREKKTIEVKAAVGYAEDITNKEVQIGEGITGWVASHRRPLRVRDVSEDPRYILMSSNTRSELAVPLIYRNELLGVLNVESEQVDAYTENDEEMLGTLGGSLAAIIANARLLEQLRTQAERERLVYDASSKIRRSTDIQSILMTTVSEITRITGARYTKIKIKSDSNSESKDVQ
jgi:GAF domain-containing protein/HAMP domain-containing protein